MRVYLEQNTLVQTTCCWVRQGGSFAAKLESFYVTNTEFIC